jgi:hypothetical protein
MMIPKRLLERLSVDDLRAAIKQKGTLDRLSRLERQKERLLRQVARIDRKMSRLDGGSTNGSPGAKRKRRKMSAETRRKMAAAARARWAKIKGAGGGK